METVETEFIDQSPGLVEVDKSVERTLSPEEVDKRFSEIVEQLEEMGDQLSPKELEDLETTAGAKPSGRQDQGFVDDRD